MKLTLLITQGSEFLIGTFKELPSVITQGRNIDEVKENILDALSLYLEDMRSESSEYPIVYQEELILTQ
jgi:predicted RNase H-like HicB family nuclease